MFAMQLKRQIEENDTRKESLPNNPSPASTHLRSVDVDGVEWVDSDEDVPHTCVDLVLGITALQVVCHRVLEVTGVDTCWVASPLNSHLFTCAFVNQLNSSIYLFMSSFFDLFPSFFLSPSSVLSSSV